MSLVVQAQEKFLTVQFSHGGLLPAVIAQAGKLLHSSPAQAHRTTRIPAADDLGCRLL